MNVRAPEGGAANKENRTMHSIKIMGGALVAALTTTLAVVTPAHADDPKDLDSALFEVRRWAGSANHFDFDEWLNSAHKILPDNGRKCLDAVAAAKKLGAKADQPVQFDDKFPGATKKGDSYLAPLSAVNERCAELNDQFNSLFAAEAVNKVQVSLDKIAGGYQPTETSVLLWRYDIKNCNEKVAAALAAGVPAAIKLAYTGQTLGTAKVNVCDALTRAQQAAKGKQEAAAKAARDGQLAPYKKLMGGDKLKLIDQYDMFSDDFELYGRGGYVIHTPAELKKAKLWFMQLENDTDSHGHPRWHLRRYQFRGDKLVKEKELHGRGEEAPDRAYR